MESAPWQAGMVFFLPSRRYMQLLSATRLQKRSSRNSTASSGDASRCFRAVCW